MLDQGVFQVSASWGKSSALIGGWGVSNWSWYGINTETPAPGSLQAKVQGSWISGNHSSAALSQTGHGRGGEGFTLMALCISQGCNA